MHNCILMVDLFHEQVIHEFGIIYPLCLFGALRNYFIYVVKLIFVYNYFQLYELPYSLFLPFPCNAFIFRLYIWLKTWSCPLLVQKILAYLDLEIYCSP